MYVINEPCDYSQRKQINVGVGRHPLIFMAGYSWIEGRNEKILNDNVSQ